MNSPFLACNFVIIFTIINFVVRIILDKCKKCCNVTKEKNGIRNSKGVINEIE